MSAAMLSVLRTPMTIRDLSADIAGSNDGWMTDCVRDGRLKPVQPRIVRIRTGWSVSQGSRSFPKRFRGAILLSMRLKDEDFMQD